MSDFEKHYSELFDYVYRYVFIRVNDKEATHDLVSEIFLSALEKEHQYDPEKGSWRQWITGISRNTVLKHWEKQKRCVYLDDLNIDYLVKEHLLPKKLDLVFQKILKSVSNELRMLLILRYQEDMTYEQISEILGKKPSAVRKAFSRLHRQLKENFIDLDQ